MKELIGLLMTIVKSNGSNKDAISEFQDKVFEADEDLFDNKDQESVFTNLAVDLDYCFSDQGTLDSGKAMRLIRNALEELKNLK